jgi:DNA polymerase-3 subunit alpha
MLPFLDRFEKIDLNIHGIRLPKFCLSKEDYATLDLPFNLNGSDLTSLELFNFLVEKGFEKRLKNDINSKEEKSYRDRLSYEMGVISPTDFVDYLLMVWDVVNIAKKNNIAVGPGRGSAASSLVLYCLGVTNIDPVKNGLYFERFLSPSRTTPNIVDGIKYYSDAADIDLDIEDSKRETLIEILKKKYDGYFCKVSTYSTLQSRKNIKEVCKIVLGYSEQQSLEISSQIPSLFGKVHSLKNAVKEVPSFAEFVKENTKAYKIALKLSELNCSKGSHASAYIVSYNKLIDSIPCEMGEDEMVTSYDMNYAQLDNIKLDLLGLKAVGIINEVCTNLNLKPENFDINYENVFSHLQDVKYPYGLFQISGDCNLGVVNKVKPKNMDDLAAVTALARPGALQFVDRYAQFVNEGKNESIHPFFDELLKSTASLALYQESTMQMCEKIGLTKADGEVIRKCIGKKKIKEMAKWKDIIFETCEKNGLNKEIPDLLWKILEDSANYSFNKSHSFSYASIAASTVYLKHKYPQQFFLACLKIASTRGDFLEQFQLIQHELPHFGIELMPPNIAKSGLGFSIEGKNIRFGLGEIKGISDKSIDKLRSFISSDIDSDFKLYNSAKDAKLGIGILSSLIQSGALGHTVKDRSKKVLEAQLWNLLTPKEKIFCINNEGKYGSDLIVMLKDYLNWIDSNGKKFTKESRLETIRKNSVGYFKIYNLNSRNELLASFFYERMLLGFSYSTTMKMVFGDFNIDIRNIDEIEQYVPVKGNFELICIVKETLSGKSKGGNRYIKMKIFDETGTKYAMLLGDKLAQYLEKSEEPKEEDILYIKGTKGDDIFWINKMEVQNHKAYTKLSELKNIE